MNRLKALNGLEAEYGYYTEDQHPSGMSMAALAEIQEYGDDINIVPRPFMAQTDDYVAQRYEVDFSWRNDLWNFLSKGGQAKTFLKNQADTYGIDSIQIVLNRQDFEDNAVRWSAYKERKYGYTQILWETGALYEGAKSKVVKTGSN